MDPNECLLSILRRMELLNSKDLSPKERALIKIETVNSLSDLAMWLHKDGFAPNVERHEDGSWTVNQ